MYSFTPGWRLNLGESQCTGTIDSVNTVLLSPNFKNVISKNNPLGLNKGQTVLGHRGPSKFSHFGSNKRLPRASLNLFITVEMGGMAWPMLP